MRPRAAASLKRSMGRLSTEAISSMNAPVPPAQLPFMRMSATSSAPVASLTRKKIIFAS